MINSYEYNELKINHKEAFDIKITNKNMELFCELSGDINPLHTDIDYAKKVGFKNKVVYGMLTSSYYSKLVGVFLPGKKCILHSIDITFTSPVYVDDTLTVEGYVFEKNDLFNQITIKAMITNQNNEKVSRAKIKVGVLNE